MTCIARNLSGICSVRSDSPQLILKKVKPTGKEIGRGAYGRVFEVEHEKTRYAAKEVHAILVQFAQGDGLKKNQNRLSQRVSYLGYTSAPVHRSVYRLEF